MKHFFLSLFFGIALIFSACSDNQDSSTNASTEPSNYSSSSSFEESSKDIESSESTISENGNFVSSSSITNTSSSSSTTSLPTLSGFLSQFTTPSEMELEFDNHVMAYNSSLTPSCEETIVSYDEDERIVPLQAVSNETIEECFPQTAPLLNQIFTSNTEVNFYAFVLEMSATPQFAVLNKFAEDGINIVVVNPGGETCIQNTWGPIVAFLLADVNGSINTENIPITGKEIQSQIWTCDEKGNVPVDIKTTGEWFGDSLL